MKKLLLLFILVATAALYGCVAQKIPGRNGFYSTKSPILSVKFNGLEYLGEFREKKGVANAHTYYYSDRGGGQGAWVEIVNTREGWNVSPAKVPGESLPNTGVYNRDIAGELYYCRTFLVQPGTGERGLAGLPGYTAVRICTKLISPSKKISIGYAGEVDADQARKIFSPQNYGGLTSAQKVFFTAFDEQADEIIIMTKFQQGDVEDKIEVSEMIENPWYRFTDFMSLKEQVRKVNR